VRKRKWYRLKFLLHPKRLLNGDHLHCPPKKWQKKSFLQALFHQFQFLRNKLLK
jgi:hypothetical protein